MRLSDTRGRVRKVFEPACGTGRLLFRLGKAGYQVSGLDLNARAVDYCNRRLERHGLPASVWVGDMIDFRLRSRVDVAFNMINSFRHLADGRQCARTSGVRRRGPAAGGTVYSGTAPDSHARYAVERGVLVCQTWASGRQHADVDGPA